MQQEFSGEIMMLSSLPFLLHLIIEKAPGGKTFQELGRIGKSTDPFTKTETNPPVGKQEPD